MIKSWILFQNMRHEKFYKSCMIEFFLTYSNGFSSTHNEQLTWQCHFPSYRKWWQTFYSAYISTWENDGILNLFLKDVLPKVQQNLYRPILKRIRKIFDIVFIWWKVTLPCKLFILSRRKIIRIGKKNSIIQLL